MNKIQKMRIGLNLHKKDVAKYLGITLKEYSSLENEYEFKDIDIVIALMTLFNCSFEDIVPTKGMWNAFETKKYEIERIKYRQDFSELVDSEGNIILYKYKPFSKHVMTDIYKNEIIMSYVKDLNDPFEGLCGFTINGVDCNAYSKYDSLAIASFSLVSNNPMMWALYSDRYKGLCYKVKVNADTLKNKGYLFGSVKYEIDKPLIKINDINDIRNIESEEYYQNLLFTKRKEWESEKEVRIIYEPDHMVTSDSIVHLIETDGRIGRVNNRLHFLKDFEMCEIIIGYLMNKSDRIKIISWARQKNIKVSVAYPNNYYGDIKFNN
jgi:DNA-binding XRE family transcriptional regulator